MSNASDIVISSLLRAMSTVNANSNNKTTSNDAFSSILDNILGNANNSCDVCEKCGKIKAEGFNVFDTLLSSVNDSKINLQNKVNLVNKTNSEKKMDSNTVSSESQSVSSTTNSNTNSTKMDNAVELLHQQIGKKYVWGATGPNTFDCSGLTQYIYKKALGKDIPRVSYDQSKFGKSVDRNNLQVGDLIFFDTMNKGRVSHVGMYIGNNEFIHAANSRSGVKKSALTGYYSNKYVCARRP